MKPTRVRHFPAVSRALRLALALALSPACHPPTTGAPDTGDRCGEGLVDDGGACVPAACGADRWGGQAALGSVFVDGAAPEGGDGSEGAAFQAIQDGVDAAGGLGGGAVLVAAGTYVENVELGDDADGVDIRGRCKDLVVIDGSGAEAAAVESNGRRLAPAIGLYGLTATGSVVGGVWIKEATAVIEDVDIVGNQAYGLVAWNDVALTRVRIADTTTTRQEARGFGIDAEGPADIVVTDSVIDNNTSIGVFAVGDDTNVTFVNTVIENTLAEPGTGMGPGLWVQSGAVVRLVGSTVAGNAEVGAGAYDGGFLEIEDSDITGNLVSSTGAGAALLAQTGGSLTVTGSRISDNEGQGVLVGDDGSRAELVDSVVSGSGGIGVGAQLGATLTMTGCEVAGNTDGGVLAVDDGTTATLDSTVVDDTAGAVSGVGLCVESGASMAAAGCSLTRNQTAATWVTGPGSTLAMESSRIADTLPDADGLGGVGLQADDGATATLTDCEIAGNAYVGVLAGDAGTRVSLVDTDVRDTRPQADGTSGRGINVVGGAALTVDGGVIERNTQMGVAVTGLGTQADIRGSEILDTAPLSAGNEEDLGGAGLVAWDGAAVRLTDVSLRGNSRVSVVVSDQGTVLDAADSEIRDTLQGSGGNDEGNVVGGGLYLDEAEANLVGCTIADNTHFGVIATGAGATLTLTDSVVSGTMRGRFAGLALAIVGEAEAHVALSGTEVSGTEGAGLYVTAAGDVTCDACLLTGNTFASALLTDGVLELADSTLSATGADPEFGGGFSVFASSSFGPPTLTIRRSVLGPDSYAAVWLDGAGSYDVEDSTLYGGAGVDWGGWAIHGNAVFAEHGVAAWDGASGLYLAGNTVRDAAIIGVFLDSSSATLASNTWGGNTLDVRQQHCEDIAALVPPPDANAVICPETNVMYAYDIDFTTLGLPEVVTEE